MAPRDGSSDQPLFRLFVGWVPKLFTEQDLLPLFKKVRVPDASSQHTSPASTYPIWGRSCVSTLHNPLCSRCCCRHCYCCAQFGDVKDIIILKDKVTGQPRGCAFVSYATKDEAEAAISALNKGVHLPGALCPMEVSGPGGTGRHTVTNQHDGMQQSLLWLCLQLASSKAAMSRTRPDALGTACAYASMLSSCHPSMLRACCVF
jgi:RNA recognition motif-containing protein